MTAPTDLGTRVGRILAWLLGALCLAAAAGMTWRALELRAGRLAGLARPTRAMLRVETVPAGCAVSLDDRHLGLAPVEAGDLPPGEHFVTAEMAGYSLKTERIHLQPATTATRLRLQLDPLVWARLEVKSDPPGATVMLNGEDRGVTPLLIDRLAPGEHRLLLRRSRCEPWSAAVQVKAGEAARVDARLEDSFLKFLEAAVANEPSDMSHRGMLFHYRMTREEWPEAADAFFAALEVMVRERVPDAGKGGLWNWFSRDALTLKGRAEEQFSARLGERLAELAGRDEKVAAGALRALGRPIGGRDVLGRSSGLVRRIYFGAARRAAGSRAVVEAALEAAAAARLTDEVKAMLAAAATARPGEGEHVGWLAARAVTLARDGSGEFRTGALSAAGEAVEKALSATPAAEPVLRARLRRLLARIEFYQDKPERALKDLDEALAAVAGAGKEEAARAAAWRLDRAEILVVLKRVEEARAILSALAADCPDAALRRQAAEALAGLPAPEKPPEKAPEAQPNQ